MQKQLLRFTLYAIIIYFIGRTLNPVTIYSNVDAPYTVRLIYFLPSDRSPQQDIDTKIDTLIREVQQFYADEMERHGFGRKTFTFETDVNGKAVVHHVDGPFTDSYYRQNTAHKVREEIREQQFFAFHRNYAVVIDISSERVYGTACGEAKASLDRNDKMFVIPASGECFNFKVAAHELGHTFGLRHDFRNNAYIMSYGSNQNKLSKCAAEWLDAHRFFNSSQTSFNESAQINKRAVIQMLQPLAYSPKAVRLRFEVTDPDGLHQAQLIIPTTAEDPVEGSKIKLHECKSLSGTSGSLEFITAELTVEPDTEVTLQVIDAHGDMTGQEYPIQLDQLSPDPTNRTPTILEKISSDNQQGLPITPLPNPLVIKVIDQNGIALEDIVVTFTVTAGGGTLSATRTMTDENGRAQSTLTLGPNLGTNTVEVSVAGITVTFNAVVGDPVDIPDPNLRAAVEIALGKAEGKLITPSGMATLTRLEKPEAGVHNLTGLEYATNLTYLDFWKSSVSDLSPVAGLTHLTHLGFAANKAISDVSALVGLTNLTALFLNGNSISDLSPLADLKNLRRLSLGNNNISNISALVGLTNLTLLKLNNNPLSYLSIKTHIPVLQNRGVIVEFDNRPHPALLKVSGDNQKGAAFASLSQPFVVEAQDANGSALAGISVKFTVTRGGGTLSTTTTMTGPNGRAQSTFILGPNLGANTVEVSAVGIQSPATFYAIADLELPLTAGDVNSDGNVNVLDLILIASNLGQSGQNDADVNGDRVVSILDLILVAGMFDGAAAAPATQLQVPATLTAVEIQDWLTDARSLEVKDAIMKRGIIVLEQLLVALTPKETELLANYPNPFNPETWIPYRLAEDAFVTLIIYNQTGQVVRTLDVGHRIASAYETRPKAIYWDGRNNLDESVASGVYFYHLSAGDFSAPRKMAILK